MTEDNYNLNELHPELVEIVNQAETTIMSDVMDSVWSDFKTIEEKMWEHIGDPDGLSSLYNVVILADNMADAMDKSVELNKDAEVIALNKPDDIDSAEGGLMGIQLIKQDGDIYDALLQASTILAVAEANPVGMIARVGGHASATAREEGVRPSKASDRKDVVITVLCTNAAVYSIIRAVNDPTDIVFDSKPLSKIETGESKLVDAIMATFLVPQVIKENNTPEDYEDFLNDLRRQASSSN